MDGWKRENGHYAKTTKLIGKKKKKDKEKAMFFFNMVLFLWQEETVQNAFHFSVQQNQVQGSKCSPFPVVYDYWWTAMNWDNLISCLYYTTRTKQNRVELLIFPFEVKKVDNAINNLRRKPRFFHLFHLANSKIAGNLFWNIWCIKKMNCSSKRYTRLNQTVQLGSG